MKSNEFQNQKRLFNVKYLLSHYTSLLTSGPPGKRGRMGRRGDPGECDLLIYVPHA